MSGTGGAGRKRSPPGTAGGMSTSGTQVKPTVAPFGFIDVC